MIVTPTYIASGFNIQYNPQCKTYDAKDDTTMLVMVSGLRPVAEAVMESAVR